MQESTGSSLRKSIGLVSETLPFLVIQGAVLLIFTCASALWLTLFLWLANGVHNPLGLMITYGVALGPPLATFRIIQHYFLYTVKAAHVAVLTRLIVGEHVSSINMVAYGKDQIQQQFNRMNVFFLIDELVNNVVDSLNYYIEALFPIAKGSAARSIIQKIIRSSYTNIGEAILSYSLSRSSENVWLTARDGLVLYAQNYRTFLKRSLQLVVIEWALTYVPVALMAVSFMLVTNPSSLAICSTVLMMGMWVVVIRHVFLQPLLMTMILLSFHNIARTQVPDQEWLKKLNQISDAFRTICDKVAQNKVYQAASGT